MRAPLLTALFAVLTTVSTLPAAIESWTNLDGQKMQAEYLGKKGDYVSFRKDDGSKYLYPYQKLNETDRARIDALAAGAPALVSPEADESDASAAPTKPAADTALGKVPEALAGKLVTVKGNKFASFPREKLGGVKFVAFYYSAHWCPPCRAFTPDLVASYNRIKAKHPEFELVFVSSDRDEASMKGYMSETNMAWPALRFDQSDSARVVRRPDNESGIPNLVFMRADGKELSLSYTSDGDYRGPRSVLADIEKHFKM